MRTRFKIAAWIAIVASSALAACGTDPETARAPRIPAAVADRLAGLSDETAAALEAGDECAAVEVAAELEREAAKAEDEIPPALRPEVEDGVEKLTSGLECVPVEPVVEPEPKEKPKPEKPECPEDKKDDKHGHGKDGEPGNGQAFGHDDEHGKDDGHGKDEKKDCKEHGHDEDGEED